MRNSCNDLEIALQKCPGNRPEENSPKLKVKETNLTPKIPFIASLYPCY